MSVLGTLMMVFSLIGLPFIPYVRKNYSDEVAHGLEIGVVVFFIASFFI